MNPTDPYSDPALIQAKNESQTALSNYGTATANALTMPDMLKKALDTKFANADQNPLYGQQKSALADYLGATNTGYQSVLPQNNNGMIFSPSSQAEQIQGRRNSALTNLAGVNQQIGGGFQGITSIIGEATNAYKAEATTAQFKSDAARQKYQDLLGEIDRKAAEADKLRTFNENVRQFNVSQATTAAGGADAVKARTAMQADIAGGANFSTLYPRYKDLLPEYEIRNAYNQGPVAKKYGPAKENFQALQKLITAPSAEEDKLKQQKIQDQADYTAIVKSLDSYSAARSGTNSLQRLNPTNVKGIKINAQRNILTQLLAKLVEKNRLSDKDRTFYLSQMPAVWMDDKQAQAAIDGIKAGIQSRLSISTKSDNSGTTTQNDGTVWKKNSNGSYTRVK